MLTTSLVYLEHCQQFSNDCLIFLSVGLVTCHPLGATGYDTLTLPGHPVQFNKTIATCTKSTKNHAMILVTTPVPTVWCPSLSVNR